jgi:site-specific DNA-methyltransferase (adenine-specific)
MKLMHGDCLIEMATIADESIDMVLCDLPYGTTACKWDSIIPFESLWVHYRRIIKDRGAIVLFGSEPFSSHLRLSNIGWFKYDWIWDKPHGTGFLNAKKAPIRAHETISVFCKSSPAYFPQKTTGHKRKTATKRIDLTEVYGEQSGVHSYDSTERYPRTIQQFSSDKQTSNLHPTQKPVALLEYLIKTYTLEGNVILDNCMGSGSTGEACLNTNRDFIGIELDKKYFDVAEKRLNKKTLKGMIEE